MLHLVADDGMPGSCGRVGAESLKADWGAPGSGMWVSFGLPTLTILNSEQG